MMQHILVCAQDPVLAKKIRYLLARDDCDVEILGRPSQLDRRLREGDVSLLILSRKLDGEDALDVVGRFDQIVVPPVIVLGGSAEASPDMVTVIPDPVDTQAIYRLASEALAYQIDGQDVVEGFSGDEDLTHVAVVPQGVVSKVNEPGPAPGMIIRGQEERGRALEEEVAFTAESGLDAIAGPLDGLEGAEPMLNEAFDEESATHQKPTPPKGRAPRDSTRPDAPLSGVLEPARFAKALYTCWSKGVSGALVVSKEHETLTIFIENGSPVHVESSIPGDQLGRALVTRGRITEAQYADGAKRAVERGLRLGQALIELAFFTGAELGRELGTTARDQIVSCFASRNGSFELDPKRRSPSEERPYTISFGHIITEGIKMHADDGVLREITGDVDSRYFKISRTIEDLQKRYPLDARELAFLEFSGRAYNVSDASDVCGLDIVASRKLMAVLVTCEEVQDFTPGVREFEARISEERQRSREDSRRPTPAASEVPKPSVERRLEPPLPVPSAVPAPGRIARPFVPPGPPEEAQPPVRKATPYEPPPPPPPPVAVAPPSPPVQTMPPAPAASDVAVPPMPVPQNGDGAVPRPLVYAKPLPRAPDGSPIETQERTLSREHFQRGVTLLGQGNFASAEEAFRDAVALCSEEHVYLIGLARAIYYNPGYRADGKVPVLKAIVGRAEQLAPDDNRVATLSAWIASAENQLRAL